MPEVVVPGGRSAMRLRVASVVPETADSVSIVFDETPQFGYRPGQFLTLRIPSDLTGSVARCYSLASSPDGREAARVIVKRTRDGYGSNWLCDNVAAGSEIEALPPSGSFSPDSLDEDLLLFAGGSGITPVLSIAKSVLRAGTGVVHLFYANQNESSVIAATELSALEVEFADRFSVTHWLESLQGLPCSDRLIRLIGSGRWQTAFACGPTAFMEAVRGAWDATGRPRRGLRLEKFVSLNGDPFETPSPSEAAETAAGFDAVPLEVEVDGSRYEFSWPRDINLVDLLVSRDVDVPYMCRDGECGTCLATCTSGQVEMRGDNLLEESDVAQGDVLACQLFPSGDDPVKVVF